MKITAKHLRQIIREEASRIEEAPRAPRAKRPAEVRLAKRTRINKMLYNLREASKALWAETWAYNPEATETDLNTGGEFASLIERLDGIIDELDDYAINIDVTGAGSARNYR